MIVTVRDRVQHLLAAGKTESEVVAEHPTSDFDAEWGHGRLSADDFVPRDLCVTRNKVG